MGYLVPLSEECSVRFTLFFRTYILPCNSLWGRAQHPCTIWSQVVTESCIREGMLKQPCHMSDIYLKGNWRKQPFSFQREHAGLSPRCFPNFFPEILLQSVEICEIFTINSLGTIKYFRNIENFSWKTSDLARTPCPKPHNENFSWINWTLGTSYLNSFGTLLSFFVSLRAIMT